ncbi:MAG: Hsp20/alpha crystallin family protein [Alphaproteobacteria bacterium]|nr:Hsp20/alpha crystallin family protein [Alphaproteobacteria bacterium]
MAERTPRHWMWSQAVEMLDEADRLHRQFFAPTGAARMPAWAPPADVLETDEEVLIFVALPGVSPEHVDASIHGAELVLSGTRVLPAELARAQIHRMELPQGRFLRRIALPPGRYTDVSRKSADGCLVITLEKANRHG